MKGLLLLGGLAAVGIVLMQRTGTGLGFQVEPWGPEQQAISPRPEFERIQARERFLEARELQQDQAREAREAEEDWLSGDRYIQTPHRLLEPYLEHLR